MSRVPRLQGAAILLLSSLFSVCLLCQAYPQAAQAHHEGSSGLDRGCLTAAEASPVFSFHLLVESKLNADQTYNPVLTVSPSPVEMFGSVRPAFQRDTPSSLNPAKLYQLNRVCRL